MRNQALSLPILTFDERALSPRFGYVFHRRLLAPYESIVGMLWKFARLNRLPGQVVAMQLCRHPVDPYEGIEPAEVDVPLVARLLGIPQRSVRTGIGNAHPDVSPCLRCCPRCLTRGYHGVLHQLERHARCPIHHSPLRTACPHCGRLSHYRLDAQLLDAPFRCRHCRRYATSSNIAPFLQRPALALMDRVDLTRAVLG